MCGIAGIVSRKPVDSALLARMGGALAHRGPDDSGVWTDQAAGIGLAHRRLAIVDITPSGHQPMASADGRWLLSYNGEIYNHLELRRTLEAEGAVPPGGWRGHSDTETLIEGIARWGLAQTLERAVGMFALALWDRRDRALTLARDRFGEKPLYYGWAGGDFVFGSELKALRLHPQFDDRIDRDALGAFAALTVIPAPRSIYASIRKLLPGHILQLHADRLGDGEAALGLSTYWRYRDVVMEGLSAPFTGEAEALDALDMALRQALAGQSVADVPVGAFLSGGIDSSTIVALYQAVSGARVKTYSIGFDEAGYDESQDARRVAAHLGTEHHEHRVGVKEAQAVIPLLPSMFDEPFADSSQIPTYLVSKFARQDVTVAISGDGGDELFAGYNRHLIVPALWQRLSVLPTPLRRAGGAIAASVPKGAWTRLARLAGRDAPGMGMKLAKGARIAGSARGIDDVFESFLDEWYGHPSPVRGSDGRGAWRPDLPGVDDAVTRMTYADATGYLPDDILVKVDRASMAVSLECRVPFLDHRVASVAARIPTAMKIRGLQGKHILRALLYRHVPKELVDRPKAGFAVPVGQWIRGPLRDWAESLLDERRLAEGGYYDARAVRARWRDHLDGRQDSTPALWSVLMFESWREAQRETR